MAFRAPTYEDIVNSKYATAMPAPAVLPQTDTRNYFQAVDNLIKVYAIRPTDKVLFLTDPLLDRRIVDAISGIANARGGSPRIALIFAPKRPSDEHLGAAVGTPTLGWTAFHTARTPPRATCCGSASPWSA